MRYYNDPLEISADAWAEVLVDRTVTEERDLIVLRLVYKSVNHGDARIRYSASFKL